ncbi:hypothetical protein ODZ84_07460 [Chryseobacterium fluminis]|uniref:hypothetical protein n=1 Tax=Chryseobacterium fluminis TaxID=2983606 RepID=UPI00224DCA17|nr:hypothetical protein [Chryseobacterium sp. MMS21-Ot14]UZT99391.1 hypothetical protein ODZ84_07460 [Chryseobacterium sp. MMS21-Ot14]
MKKYILIIFLALLSLFIVAANGNFSDFREKGPSGYVFIFEGSKQNAIMRNNELVIDSGAVDFKYNKNYVVFSVDTTYSMKPQEINKSQLKYYLFDVKTNVLKENIKFDEFKTLVKEKSLEDIDITK